MSKWGWPDAPESPAGSNRYGWPDTIGTGGRITPEYAFDIDQKDNPNLNMEELKQKIIAYTCTVYGKISPRGGLKFAVQTNFHNIVSDDTQNYDDIFSRAHDLVYSEIKSEVGEFENDDCTKNIMQTCILSYDHCIYLNLEPEPILFSQDQINKFQEEIAAQCSSSSSNGIFDAHDDLDELQDEFLNLLSGIPQCLDFNSRRPVNFTALYLFGEQGRHIMQSHWIVEDRKKLEQDLKSQMQSAKYHCMNKVRALSTNYSNVSNTLPGWSCAAPSAMVFQERMSIDEARVDLRKAIDAFVDNPKNTIIKAPCGIGKSTYMAKILADMSHKVLYLSPSHSLTEEIHSAVIEQQRKLKQSETSLLKRKWKHYFQPAHIHGRNSTGSDGVTMCENKTVREFYGEAKVSIPKEECLKCHLNPCRYIAQFDDLSNIRFATHNGLRNSPSNWENGSIGIQKGLTSFTHDIMEKIIHGHSDYSAPRNGNWIPDFIVVDEAFLSGEGFDLTTDVKSKSLHNIMLSVLGGGELFSSILDNALQIREDFGAFLSNEVNSKKTIGNAYIDCKKKYSSSEAIFLKIFFEALEAGYVTTELSAVRCDSEINPTRLKYNPLLAIHERFRNVPVLVFDATADEGIYNHIYPDAIFHEITARPSEHFKVFQCQNVTLSKKDFRGKPELLQAVAEDIAGKIRNHRSKRVGLISYKSTGMPGEDKSFVNKLRDHVASLVDDQCIEIITLHFGNLRGSNAFNDCDLVFVVGRYQVHENAILGKAQQILGHAAFETAFEKQNQHSRYREDDAISFSNYVNKSKDLQEIQNAFGRAETIQSIYRARPFTDDPKTVYYYSSASLGADVSIDGVFDLPFGERFEFLQKLQKVGYCHIVPRELVKLGLGNHAGSSGGRKERIKQLLNSGVEKFQFIMRQNGKDVTREYLVTDIHKLEEHLVEKGFNVKQCAKMFS